MEAPPPAAFFIEGLSAPRELRYATVRNHGRGTLVRLCRADGGCAFRVVIAATDAMRQGGRNGARSQRGAIAL